ncbi:MAG: DUF424 domain-containing protein [Candidatus Jordarchaeum sp.]|uniref:DUF424 domain-containing protein n=1 Tax=Candidatus Jordarchaeum sp. TaxID=2823881 RepID=UPI00404B2991
MRVYIYIRKVNNETMVAACDEDIVGKTFREGKLKIEVKKEFYCGELVEIEEGIEAISKGTIVNIVGNTIVSKAINAGLIHPQGIITIGGVAHAQKVIM